MLKVYYRLSDKNRRGKAPPYVTNENCLNNFFKNFELTVNDKFTIIADNISEDTETWLKNKKLEYIKTSLGNCGSFDFSLKHAINESNLNDNDIVYFVENDYIHRKHSRVALEEGFDHTPADYITLYDGPEKYCRHYNINYNNFVNFNEAGFENFKSKIYACPNFCWRTSNCTTMTFAGKVKTFKEDYDMIRFNLVNMRTPEMLYKTIPSDWQMFVGLIETRSRILINPIPGFCTHGDLLSPYIQWSQHI